MHTERADAARNRAVLIETAREMVAELGVDKLTMDALAERSGLGKGTVFRRFGTRAGIFMALLDAGERGFQARVLSGPPPLGPGAEPLDRLLAFGRARVRFLQVNADIARAALGGRPTVPSGPPSTMTGQHIRMLLTQLHVDSTDVDVLAMQLTAALEVPLLLYPAPHDRTRPDEPFADRLSRGWEEIVLRLAH